MATVSDPQEASVMYHLLGQKSQEKLSSSLVGIVHPLPEKGSQMELLPSLIDLASPCAPWRAGWSLGRCWPWRPSTWKVLCLADLCCSSFNRFFVLLNSQKAF
jgi:hypothetical protein